VWNVLKTLAFLVVFWTIFLFGLPLAITIVEVRLGVQRSPPQAWLAQPLLLVTTSLTIWSAFTFALRGDGTPLAVDAPRQFVTSGPYAYVRHPFVMGVIGQIVALGVSLGSIPVLAYASLLMSVWYYGVRPREEQALLARFGDAARHYFSQVRGFRPRTTRYRP
jgi:protein-S-isoprenylcysteine O-methyltransferase Ste14